MHKILILNLFIFVAIESVFSKPTNYFYKTYNIEAEDNKILKFPKHSNDFEMNIGPYPPHVFQNLRKKLQPPARNNEYKSRYPMKYPGGNTLTNDVIKPAVFKLLKNNPKRDQIVERTTTHRIPEEKITIVVTPEEVVAPEEDLEKIVNDIFAEPMMVKIESRFKAPTEGIDGVVICSLLGGCV